MAEPTAAAVTREELAADPHRIHARLRDQHPVMWVPALDGWLVTSRAVAVEVMRDAPTFTVDHPGFTTAQVVGPSMLSRDGGEHRRHRDPFSAAFRIVELRRRFSGYLAQRAAARVAMLHPDGEAELRTALAAPFAVEVVAELLGMLDIDPAKLLGIYRRIVGAVTALSRGEPLPLSGPEAVAELRHLVDRSLRSGGSLLARAARELTDDEVASNAAVMLFGGIETNEGMTATALWYLLTVPGLLERVTADRALVASLIEESLRLEPAASRVDRYATTDVELAGAHIAKDDLVIVSLAAANRDPAAFVHPDHFDVLRNREVGHVAFAQGPHTCLGLHLARMETQAAVSAVLDALPGIRIDMDRSAPPAGLVFRKPGAVLATWTS